VITAAVASVIPHSVVLVVEDEAESRESLRDVLELEGYEVETAANGQEALEKIKQHEPCIVLLDLFMPVMDGWQLLDQLRADGLLGRIKVVVTTSAASNTPTDVPVFLKPLDIDRLLQTVEAVC